MQALYCNCVPLLPKRLTYPELLPLDQHAKHFYNDFDDLVKKLEIAIRDIETTWQQSLRSIAAQYDWDQMAPYYDNQLQTLR